MNSMRTIVGDEYGPEYVIEINESALGMRGFLVIDNTALGPGKGGLRMTPNVSPEEVFRLARTMTWKNALAGLPFGGAKSGIIWQGGDLEKKKQFIRAFARALTPLMPKRYITAPDVNVGEEEMRWFVEENGNWKSATGKPANLCMEVFGKPGERCGIPHEFGSTGFGVAHATAVAAEHAGINLKQATVAIHGFGNVGTFTYQFLDDLGARVVALADSSGAVYAEHGFQRKILDGHIAEGKKLSSFTHGRAISEKEFWKLPVTILIPASVTDVINESNRNDIQAKIIMEAANIPMNEEAENWFAKKGVLVVPDFVANAGGVISSYAEYRGYNPKRMFELVERKVRTSTARVLKESAKRNQTPRAAGLALAKEIVRRKMTEREERRQKEGARIT